RRDRHDPVDGREAHRKDIKDDAWAGQHFEAEAQGAVFAVVVLPLRQYIEDEHQNKPDGKINNRANVKTVSGEVALLKFRESAFARCWRIEPAFLVTVSRIEMLHPE